MALHKVNDIIEGLDAETIEDLRKQNLIWTIDEKGAWANAHSGVADLTRAVEAIKRAKASEGMAKGIWRRIDGEWLVETDATVGEQVFITRRDGSYATKYVIALVDGFARVSDYAPKAEATTETKPEAETQPEAEATVTAAPARKADPEALVMVTDQCPSVYGSHLLGFEGQRVRRAFRDHGTGVPTRRRH